MKKIIILAAMIGIFWGCDRDEYMVYEDDARLQFGRIRYIPNSRNGKIR